MNMQVAQQLCNSEMAPPLPPPPRKISHSCSAGTLPTYTQLQVGGDGLLLVPAPSRPPSTHQGHAHITHGNAFLRVWVEIRTTSLHIYPHEAATLPSLVVANLDQCDVTLSHHVIPSPHDVIPSPHDVIPSPHDVIPSPHDVIPSPHDVIASVHDVTFSHQQRHQIHPPYRVSVSLKGCEQVSLYHYNPREAEVWAAMLKVTTVHRSLQLEGLNLECGVAGADEEDMGSGDSCETESQEEEDDDEGEGETGGGGRDDGETMEIRRDDGEIGRDGGEILHMRPNLRSKDDEVWRRSVALTAGEVVNEYDRAQHQAQQSALRKAVILRQRKNSTAIKMATLEKKKKARKF
ncbi:hypothetical protein Pcinc_014191 [Petrolisthes cinctipes]|uniref:Uncharacterized protein n=1 Tax=Petrolisthes cinctipes TaxID=88211 RepID=A0AAE1FWX7_PETCI|nr:hypothetical protein Pcinc_014191 [Petrolisthes cinctipes]